MRLSRQKAATAHLVTSDAEEQRPRALSPWIWRPTGLEQLQLLVGEQGASTSHQHTPASFQEVVDIIDLEGDFLIDRTARHDSEGDGSDAFRRTTILLVATLHR